MTNRRDQKALVRERMAKTGESYAAARRHVVGAVPTGLAGPTSDGETGSRDTWYFVRRVTRYLEELLAELETGQALALQQDDDLFTFALQEDKGPSLMLRAEWRMSLISTMTTLAEHLHLEADVTNLGSHAAAFWGTTPDTVERNSFVKLARRLVSVANRMMAALGDEGPASSTSQPESPERS